MYVMVVIQHVDVLFKKFYDAKEAQLDYERTLSDSRSGVMITDDELAELDNLISPLIKNGQSIYHITINNSDQINWSSKTLYIRTSIRIVTGQTN